MIIDQQGNVAFHYIEGKKNPYRIIVNGDACWYKINNFDRAVNEYKIVRKEQGVYQSPFAAIERDE